MNFKLIGSNISSLFPYICVVGILNWFIVMAISVLMFKKLIKDELDNNSKNELKKVNLINIIDFKYSLVYEYRFSVILMIIQYVFGLMALGSILILFDSSKVFYCISYITLPILEIIIFKMAKCKLKERLNNKTISVNKYIKKEPFYKLVIN